VLLRNGGKKLQSINTENFEKRCAIRTSSVTIHPFTGIKKGSPSGTAFFISPQEYGGQ